MKSPFAFLVKPLNNKRYSNTKQLGGVEFVVSASTEDHKFSNREAEVIETPLGYDGPVKVGDLLLVHHNVFKYYNDMKGRQRSGKSYFKDDLFFVENDQYYAYKSDGIWNPIGRYCFVKPVRPQDSYIFKPMSEEPLVGEIKYPNEYLKSEGLLQGDRVCFKPDSEYEFTIDGEKLYRMFDHQITIVL